MNVPRELTDDLRGRVTPAPCAGIGDELRFPKHDLPAVAYLFESDEVHSRASLTGGNLAVRLYEKWLTKFLDWIERFFGDVGMADRPLFPHAFGLKTPAPLWTAPPLALWLALWLTVQVSFSLGRSFSLLDPELLFSPEVSCC